MKTKEFVIGMIAGIVIGSLLMFTATKTTSLDTYQIYMGEGVMIKLNKRTGETWRSRPDGWEPYRTSNYKQL